MKKIINSIVDIVFMIALTMLGRYDLQSMHLGNYQFIVTVFWVSGIIKYMCSEKELKEDIMDAVKDLIVSLIIIPLWYMLSGNIESDIYEPKSILIHLIVLVVIIWVTNMHVEINGKAAYVINMIIPIIALVLIRMGVSEIPSVVIAVVIPNSINQIIYLKQKKKCK